jgi:O-acetyl-ADP-ribose deacetylase (regulator of RNase III)
MLTVSIISNRNIFDTQCQTIVNTVNCVGVMGKGIALEMKNRYPDMFEKYKTFCDNKLIDIGKLWLYKNPDDKWILNFPTKTHWRYQSEYDYIEKGMQKFIETYKDKNIKSIAFPMLGCSNGGLNEEKVLEIMMKYFSKCDELIIEIYR